jgi:hypothetical protein
MTTATACVAIPDPRKKMVVRQVPNLLDLLRDHHGEGFEPRLRGPGTLRSMERLSHLKSFDRTMGYDKVRREFCKLIPNGPITDLSALFSRSGLDVFDQAVREF